MSNISYSDSISRSRVDFQEHVASTNEKQMGLPGKPELLNDSYSGRFMGWICRSVLLIGHNATHYIGSAGLLITEGYTCLKKSLSERTYASIPHTEELVDKFRAFDLIEDDKDVETLEEREKRARECAALWESMHGSESRISIEAASRQTRLPDLTTLRGLFTFGLLLWSRFACVSGKPSANAHYTFQTNIDYDHPEEPNSDSQRYIGVSMKEAHNAFQYYGPKIKPDSSGQLSVSFSETIKKVDSSGDFGSSPQYNLPGKKLKHCEVRQEINRVIPSQLIDEICRISIPKDKSHLSYFTFILTPADEIYANNLSIRFTPVNSQTGKKYLEENRSIFSAYYIALLTALLPASYLAGYSRRRKYEGYDHTTPFSIQNLQHQPEMEHLGLQVLKNIHRTSKASGKQHNARIERLAKKLAAANAEVNPALKPIIDKIFDQPTRFDFQNVKIDEWATKVERYKVALNHLIDHLSKTFKSSPITINCRNIDIKKRYFTNRWNSTPWFWQSTERFYRQLRNQAEQTFILNPLKNKIIPELFRPAQNNRPTYGALNYNHARYGAAPSNGYGRSYAVLAPSIKNRCVYALGFTLQKKITCNQIPRPTTNFRTLAIDLMESFFHKELLESIVEFIFSPHQHFRTIHRTTVESLQYIECMLFENIDMTKHFSEFHIFTDRKCSEYSSEEIQRFIEHKRQDSLPFDLYIDEQKIHPLPLPSVTIYTETQARLTLSRLIANGTFRRLSPDDKEIKAKPGGIECPITLSPLRQCASIIAYKPGVHVYYVEESAILQIILTHGIFKCPYTQKPLTPEFGPCPSGTMDVSIKYEEKIINWATQRKKIQGVAQFYVIEYYIYPGYQTSQHQNPGLPHRKDDRVAYLPKTDIGAKVCQMLRVAFANRQTFTVGRSLTRGVDNVVVWNDIHHKTSITSGPYALSKDYGYLARVKRELEAKGIKYPESVPDDKQLTTFLDNRMDEHLYRIKSLNAQFLSENTPGPTS